MDDAMGALDRMLSCGGRMGLGFSGGSDSSFLLHHASRLGVDVRAYFVETPFNRRCDLGDAQRVCDEIGVELTVLHADALGDESIAINGPGRCYRCKLMMFSEVIRAAREDGCAFVADGTNASDDADDRPGMRALRELGVVSPLRDAGITKGMVRELSREVGLSTWDLASNSCLATRVVTGTRIENGLLRRIESAEDAVSALGFSDFRVRTDGVTATVRMARDQHDGAKIMEREIAAAVGAHLCPARLDDVTRD